MRIDRRSLVVLGILLLIVVFIIIYAKMLMDKEPSDTENLEGLELPELKEESEQYNSRLEAVDELSEKKPLSPPGLYDEDLIDQQGQYDPYLQEREKVALMDSILGSGPDLQDYQYEETPPLITTKSVDSITTLPSRIKVSQIGEGHANFFLTASSINESVVSNSERRIRVEVNGDQVVRKDERLELRLIDSIVIQGDSIPSNTLLYGFCSFQPNRLLIRVPQIGKKAILLEAYDISDGQKGIYIENSFRSQATAEVIDDVIQDINVSGVPQVSGLKGILQRSNRSVKVKALHQYKLYLKPVL